MKKCIKCGCEIEYGVNGCMLMNECFECHGGYPNYIKSTKNIFSISWDELDYIEGKCLGSED